MWWMSCFSLFPIFGIASPNLTSRKATLNAISNLHHFSIFPSATNVSIEKQFILAKWTVVWTNSCEILFSSSTDHVVQVLCLLLEVKTRNLFLNIIICHQTVMLYFPCTLNPYWCMSLLVGKGWGWGEALQSEDWQGGFETSTFSL